MASCGLTDEEKFNLLLDAIINNKSLSDYGVVGRSCKNILDEDVGFKLTLVVAIFGSIAVTLNLIIITVLLINCRSLLKHVFYVLLMNFAIIDTIRGTCLLISSTFQLQPKSAHNGTDTTLIVVHRSANLVLQFCALVIIFNLLFITLNEYVFVCWPFQYQHLINRSRVLIALACCWLLSACFVILATITRHPQATSLWIRGNVSVTDPDSGQNSSDIRNNIRRDVTAEVDLIFNFTLLGFCFLCLVVIVICYASFFRVVRRIQRDDERLRRELVNVARDSLSSADPTHRTSVDASQNRDERRVRRQVLRRHKYAIVIGIVIAVYMLYLFSYSATQVLVILMLKNQYAISQFTFRWTIKVIFGLHAVLQPLCYLRVREFRVSIMKTFCTKAYIRKQRHEEMFNSMVTSEPGVAINGTSQQHRDSIAMHRNSTAIGLPYSENRRYGRFGSIQRGSEELNSAQVQALLSSNGSPKTVLMNGDYTSRDIRGSRSDSTVAL